jgi:uncharacterized protein YqgV (UPF0045/DUF77 family)
MADIVAQVSVYPLREPHLSPATDEVVRVLQDYADSVSPGVMSTLVAGDGDKIFAALQEAWGLVAAHGEVVMVVTLSNACPAARADNGPG